jgi:hypothetical protein
LYDRPVLIVDPGMHTAPIRRAAADAEGRWAVTGSPDKTIRIWSLGDGKLMNTIRLPAGSGNVGMVYAVAISPDATLIAAGGWTRASVSDPQEQIYLFDRASGVLAKRIVGLPNRGDNLAIVNHLTFSPDGERLAAVLGAGGLRVYSRETGWAEVARDEGYGDQSYGADFSADSRLATTALDGRIRLYASDLRGTVQPVRTVLAPSGADHLPYGIAFDPDGGRLAVGYELATAVDLLDARTLSLLARPRLSGIDNGNLHAVAWSRDGAMLFAAGLYGWIAASVPVLAWGNGGSGDRRALRVGADTVMTLVPLPGGDLLVAAADPWLGRLGPDGRLRWLQGSPKVDFSHHFDRLLVSAEGARVGFGFEAFGASSARFDLSTRALTRTSSVDAKMAAPRQEGLLIENWHDQDNPTLDGDPLPLLPHERSRSLAIHT